jgi:hypothetical protein
MLIADKYVHSGNTIEKARERGSGVAVFDTEFKAAVVADAKSLNQIAQHAFDALPCRSHRQNSLRQLTVLRHVMPNGDPTSD